MVLELSREHQSTQPNVVANFVPSSSNPLVRGQMEMICGSYSSLFGSRHPHCITFPLSEVRTTSSAC